MDLSTKDEEKNMKDNFIFDEDGNTVWIIWDKEKENEKKKSLANILDSTYGEYLRFIAGLY